MGYRPTQLGSALIALLMGCLALSFITGLGLWYVHEQREKLADLPRWTSLCQSLHGLLNPVICVIFGILCAHIVGGWRMRVNRKSGGGLTLALGALIATGAALYYSEHRHFYFTIHLLAGLLLPFLIWIHWASGRRWVRTLPGK